MILGLDAGVRGDPAGQKAHYDQLTAAFPKDERALNLLGGYYFGRQEYPEAIAAYRRRSRSTRRSRRPTTRWATRTASSAATTRRRRRSGSHRADSGRPQPPRLVRRAAHEDGPLRGVDQELREGALGRPVLVASYVGIGLDQIYLGREEGRETLVKLEQVARNGGEKRAAYAQTAFSYVAEGNTAAAVKEVEKMKAVAKQEGDTSALAGDENFLANIHLEPGQPDVAARHFAESLKLSEAANTNDDVKQAARRQKIFDAARVALAKGDAAGAQARSDEYAAAVASRKIPFEIRQSHEIAGLVALQAKDYAKASGELSQANQLDPRVQYHLAAPTRDRETRRPHAKPRARRPSTTGSTSTTRTCAGRPGSSWASSDGASQFFIAATTRGKAAPSSFLQCPARVPGPFGRSTC